MAEDTKLGGLRLVGAAWTAELREAITGSPVLERTIGGGSTLKVEVADYRRLLVTSPAIAGTAYAEVAGLRFELVRVEKTGDMVTLTFEDSVVTELKRPRPKLVIPASTQTRAQIVERLCREAGVRVTVDPASRGVVNEVVERAEQGASWELLKSVADDAGWRCFSDGWQVIVGSDAWLASLSSPLSVRENTGPVGAIDFEMDVALPASRASVDVAAERWSLPPGRAVRVERLGWADGDWLVESFSRTLTSSRADVGLVRRGLVLAEAPPQNTGEADPGEPGFLPDADSGGADIAGDLARLRQCESGGNYKAVNPSGKYFGAYQFDIPTWRGLGYPGRPDEASPATQDEAATKLYQRRGWKPWPACSKRLGLVDRRGGSGAGATATGAPTGDPARDRMVTWALSKRGLPYVWGAKGPRAYDCSGFTAAATAAGGRKLDGNSKTQFATCGQKGKLVDVDVALRTRGALLFRMTGNPTHVAISLGDGSTIEARGKAYGVGVFTGAARRGWTDGAIWI